MREAAPEELRSRIEKLEKLLIREKRTSQILSDRAGIVEAKLNRIGLLASGDKAYTRDFTTEVMGIVREET